MIYHSKGGHICVSPIDVEQPATGAGPTSDDQLIELMIEDAQIDRTHSVHVAMMREHVEKIRAEARRAALEEAAAKIRDGIKSFPEVYQTSDCLVEIQDLMKGGDDDG